jgi:hypothetical protein
MVALVGRMLDLNKRAHDMKPGHARTVIEREIAATDRTVDELVYELCGSPTRRSGSSRRRRRGRAGSVRAGLRQRRRGGRCWSEGCGCRNVLDTERAWRMLLHRNIYWPNWRKLGGKPYGPLRRAIAVSGPPRHVLLLC